MGFFGIGIERSKTGSNIGTLWRSAYCFGASFIFTIGERYRHQPSDTCVTPRQIPYWRFLDLDDFKKHIPFDCPLVGIEITETARRLIDFTHPKSAIYLLGPEDGSLSQKAVSMCQHIVKINSARCLNVSSAGSIVLYDRQSKVK